MTGGKATHLAPGSGQMLDRAAGVNEVIEYNVVLAPLVDGKIYLSLTATTIDEIEPQLLNQEIVRDYVATIDNALAIIKAGILNVNNAS